MAENSLDEYSSAWQCTVDFSSKDDDNIILYNVTCTCSYNLELCVYEALSLDFNFVYHNFMDTIDACDAYTNV